MNEKIRAKEVRLIGAEKEQLGVVPIEKARDIAKQGGLDLILISNEAKPPVCKLIDYGQFRYEQQKKEKQARKTSRAHVLKELKVSPKISDHDYNVRLTNGKKFLTKGYKIKVTCFFKGRELAHPELGMAVLKRFIEDIKELGTPEGHISRSARSMILLINPNK